MIQILPLLSPSALAFQSLLNYHDFLTLGMTVRKMAAFVGRIGPPFLTNPYRPLESAGDYRLPESICYFFLQPDKMTILTELYFNQLHFCLNVFSQFRVSSTFLVTYTRCP